jgi:hypothetical protein
MPRKEMGGTPPRRPTLYTPMEICESLSGENAS